MACPVPCMSPCSSACRAWRADSDQLQRALGITDASFHTQMPRVFKIPNRPTVQADRNLSHGLMPTRAFLPAGASARSSASDPKQQGVTLLAISQAPIPDGKVWCRSCGAVPAAELLCGRTGMKGPDGNTAVLAGDLA